MSASRPNSPRPAQAVVSEAHRAAAEDRFIALVRQEAMRPFVGCTADLRDDDLRAAFSIALLALRETHDDAQRDAAVRADAPAAIRSARANAELEALKMLSMQLVDIGEAAPDDLPGTRPRKRSIGH